MTPLKRAILVGLVLLWVSWLARYELVAWSVRPLVLDRWTGRVYIPRLSETPAPAPYIPGDGP